MDIREIKVGKIFRILAGIVSAGVISTFILDFQKSIQFWILDGFNLMSLIIIWPLFSYVAIFGKVPSFILNNVSEDMFHDLVHTEKFFKEFNQKSIGFALVAISMFAYIIFREHLK